MKNEKWIVFTFISQITQNSLDIALLNVVSLQSHLVLNKWVYSQIISLVNGYIGKKKFYIHDRIKENLYICTLLVHYLIWVRYNESSHWFSRISQIFYACVIVPLRFARIVIRPKVLFIRGNQKVTLSCIVLSVKIRGICGRRNIILLTSNSRYSLFIFHYSLRLWRFSNSEGSPSPTERA